MDLDYSSSSSASPSSVCDSDSSTDFGSLSDASEDEGNDPEKRKQPSWNKTSSKERKRRRQRRLESRLSALLADATSESPAKLPLASDGKKKTRKATRSKGLGTQERGIGATLDEWDRWEMMSQQQALVRLMGRFGDLFVNIFRC